MRIGIFGDLHGNPFGLAAALAALDAARVDRLVCLGDVAADGPLPRETIARLRAVGGPVVMGNADAQLFDPPPPADLAGDAARFDAIGRWGAAQLSDDDRAFLRSFAPTVSVDLPGGRTLLACHGSPRSFDEALPPDAADATLAEALAGFDADVVAAGHTHLPMARRVGGRWLVNPGSVGLPYDPIPPDATTVNPPWAEYAILDAGDDGSLGVTLGRAAYDVAPLLAVIRASGMPFADWLADGWRAG
jgi:predicted phosphodiesterase